MRVGRFEESLQSVDRTFELLEKTQQQFGTDLELVQSKFYMLKSNVCFVLRKYQECDAAATEGLASIERINTSDADILRSIKNTTRDLTNNQIRSRAKLLNTKASLVREKVSSKLSTLEKMISINKLKNQQQAIIFAPMMAAWNASVRLSKQQ